MVTMYSTVWCGYCRRLKSQMEREGIPYTEVDIEHDPRRGRLRDEGQRRQPDRPDPALP
jgi:glutaredoxin